MPSPLNITNITPPRVPLTDPRTGMISREWYRFFLNMFQLVGDGSNPISLTDVQKGPPSIPIEAVQVDPNAPTNAPSDSPLLSQIAEINKQLNALESQPECPCEEYFTELQLQLDGFETAPPNLAVDLNAEVDKKLQGLEVIPRLELGTMAALQQANVPWMTFDTTPNGIPPDVGTMAWDGGTTLGLQMTANVLLKVGEAEYVYVKASSAITKGQLCYHTGSVGASGVITAAPTPINLTDPNQIVGVAAETIALNDFGLIQVSGDLRGFNTTGSSVGEAWADGDPLYYNPAYVGSFTKTKPSAPNQKTYIGEVINAGSGSSGSINIRIIPGSVLGGTDSNVQFSGVANGDLIQYDSALQYWKNVPASTLPVGTATNLAGGAAGSVPYQSASSTTTFLSIGAVGRWLGSSGTAPQWNAPAALTKTDDTNVTITLGGSASTALLNAASLTLGWTGQLSLTRGGTNANLTASAGSIAYSTTTALALNTAGSSGDWLKSGGTGAPTWTAPAALTKTDDTNVTLTLGGSPTTALLNAASLTLGWTGQLAVSRGGTGVSTTPANGQLLIGNGTGYTVANLTQGTGVTITNSAGGISISATGTGGTVTSVSVVSANGFAGSVATSTTTPAITISTSITGLLYGNGTAMAATTVSSPLSYSAGTLSIPVATSSANGYLSSTDWSTFNAKQPVAAPVTQTANFSVGATDVWTINNKSGSSCTVTLPTASSNTGRVLYFLNYQAQTLVSASSNVVPLAGGSATTAILEAVAGANATLVSNGTNWIMTQYDSNNALQLE
jgi:hypothetical protein